jgi:putative nucleotidyltransferase with HDIG domain
LLHDIGAIPLDTKTKKDLYEFDVKNPFKHSVIGSEFMKLFGQFSHLSEIVLHHHTFWENGKCFEKYSEIPEEAFIIHLADRIDILLQGDCPPDSILSIVKKGSGQIFKPEHVEAFESAMSDESFWEIADQVEDSSASLCENAASDDIEVFIKFISQVIDYKSRFTASHSRGVSTVAKEIAGIMELPEDEQQILKYAGLLHDIGKLAVPVEIIEKPGALSDDEKEVMNSHPLYTKEVLRHLKGQTTLINAATYHHEKLNGTGYPKQLKAHVLVAA